MTLRVGLPEWMDRAACRAVPPAAADLAFDRAEEQRSFIDGYCRRCPVQAECGLAGEGEPGVWGGKTAYERGGKRVRINGAVCGTASGYARHYRAGEPACAPCKVAKSEAVRSSYNRRSDRLPPTDTGRCGTWAGYQQHRRLGEYACEPCMDGQRAYAAKRRAG